MKDGSYAITSIWRESPAHTWARSRIRNKRELRPCFPVYAESKVRMYYISVSDFGAMHRMQIAQHYRRGDDMPPFRKHFGIGYWLCDEQRL